MTNTLKGKKILVVGLSGSGKTYISKNLKSLGIPAYDADEVDGLAGWFDKKGNKTTYPENASKEWLEQNDWLWDKEFLKNWLNENEEVILFGVSSNWTDCLDLFDNLFCLSLNAEELRKRLSSEDRENSFGKTEEQQEQVIKNTESFVNYCKSYNAVIINASQDPKAILDFILNKLT